jgi:hypothetical protein
LPGMTDFQPRWDWFRELGRQRPPPMSRRLPSAGGSRAHQRKISTRQFTEGVVTMSFVSCPAANDVAAYLVIEDFGELPLRRAAAKVRFSVPHPTGPVAARAGLARHSASPSPTHRGAGGNSRLQVLPVCLTERREPPANV